MQAVIHFHPEHRKSETYTKLKGIHTFFVRMGRGGGSLIPMRFKGFNSIPKTPNSSLNILSLLSVVSSGNYMPVILNTIQWSYSINSQISTNVYLLYVRTEPHVLILLEVIAVIAWLDTLEATVKQVTTG